MIDLLGRGLGIGWLGRGFGSGSRRRGLGRGCRRLARILRWHLGSPVGGDITPAADPHILASIDVIQERAEAADPTGLSEDPGVHADQFSPIGEVLVEMPGWHAFKLLYFERKNTSTLQLHRRRPGDPPGTMPLVPADVLGHLPEG